MTAITWIQGKDLVSVNVGTTPVISTDLSIILQSGHGAYLPAAPFFLYFIGNDTTGELAEYVYITTKTGDTLTIGTPPFGNTGGNGRAALANTAPNSLGASNHAAGATLQLRSTYEHFQQLQSRVDNHNHEGTTGNGPQLDASVSLVDLSVNTAKLGNLQVTAGKIANHTITNLQIAANTIGTTEVDSTIVLLTAAQTLTNKTLTSPTSVTPTINVGSDARGDLYARGSTGAITRVAIPASGNRSDWTLMVNTSGDPVWAAPPIRHQRAFLLMGA